MKINSETRLLGLLGSPSKHSLSPVIQNFFIRHYGLNCVYLSFEPDPEDLDSAFFGARDLDFIGLNVTMPFKDRIYNLVDSTEGPASVFKAVNTVKFLKVGKLSTGFSTDGEGVIKTLEDRGFDWEDKNCLIIGAGGAAKSAVFSISKKPVNTINVYDIEVQKTITLINMIGEDDKIKAIKDINKVNSSIYKSIDLVMNCTPVGMNGGNGISPALPIPGHWNLKGKTVFEMAYKPVVTDFLKKALSDGALTVINGIEMLINQAAFSFKIWFDILPEENVIKSVKEKILKLWN